MKVLYLPPYSPDFNPIELCFSAIKHRVRRFGNIARAACQNNDDTEVYLFLYSVAFSVSKQDIRGFYRHCNYVR
jgi:transposase